MLSTMLIPNLKSNLSHHVKILKYSACKIVKLLIQYTLANPNRVVSIKKKSVPISEFVRISELIHLYGEFCSESL